MLLIREAAEADAPALLAIYRPLVESTAVSFEAVAPSQEEFAARIAKILKGWQWLVAERNGECAGYAYASSHRERAAYRWSVEVSAYVHSKHQRQGIGQALYRRLLRELEVKGFCNAYAGIALPNEASVALHRSVGLSRWGCSSRSAESSGAGTTWRGISVCSVSSPVQRLRARVALTNFIAATCRQQDMRCHGTSAAPSPQRT